MMTLLLYDPLAVEETWEIRPGNSLNEASYISISIFYFQFPLTCVLDIVIAVILFESHLCAPVLVLDWRLLETPGNLARDSSLRNRAELAWRAQSGPRESAGAEDREERGWVTSVASSN